MPQQSALAYVRHGQSPFFRLPSLDLTKEAPYAGTDAVLLGVPWDGAVTYRPGARFGPYAVRSVSALVQSYHPVHKLDVFHELDIIDGGNVVLAPFDAEATRACIEGGVAGVLDGGAVPFLVGGDHSITLPALRALHAKHGPVHVVHVDAHLDTSTGEIWGNAFHHGTPFRHALAEGLIAAGGLTQIGMRGPWSHPEDGAFSADHRARRYDMDLVSELGVKAVAEEIRETLGDKPVYISFDIDAVDPAYAPGTGTPVPGGFTAREALQLVRGLAGCRLVGMDVVELAPDADHADVTTNLVAYLLYEGLAGLALRRSQRR
jgi:agmatinase